MHSLLCQSRPINLHAAYGPALLVLQGGHWMQPDYHRAYCIHLFIQSLIQSLIQSFMHSLTSCLALGFGMHSPE